ncbi:allantoate amidohydrolase [Actinomadura macrotermitis]|uniref:N-carbamoyl-L-amino acid hydrolase n=1 Tax=Actinomadura macrotermitis TaxID=2585200 RepID=A0A7K0BPW8_9ACTN|nr:allantoate amidohydrolase [Actinomadura macrotermitis]MQY03239.1 N-carbamoyl-L-amino acid hydrolase [Actinomadura macrotermitis]
MSFEEMWAELLPIGRDAAGGYHRFAWTPPELECRAWFLDEAARRDLEIERDANGNLYAWWLPADGSREDAVLTGSHLDSVPGGGAFDGPLGVVSAFAAIDLLRERGYVPARPIGVAAFAEEEGARFGVACLGSRLLAGAIAPERARGLRDGDGRSFAEVLVAHGMDPDRIGPDEGLLARIGCYVELHVEQGRALQQPVGVASSIVPHGRWRLDFTGEGNHAGTTLIRDRRDPMLPFAITVLAARQAADRNAALATIGKVAVTPNGVNAIPSRVTAWLDSRGPIDDAVRRTVEEIGRAARAAAGAHGVAVELAEESYTEVVSFDTGLRERLLKVLPDAPVLPTGAGHDAGILAARVPTAMLFVRNPTGVSHAPAEHAEPDDCLAGVEALAAVLDDLARG